MVLGHLVGFEFWSLVFFWNLFFGAWNFLKLPSSIEYPAEAGASFNL